MPRAAGDRVVDPTPRGVISSESMYTVDGSAGPYAQGAMGTIWLAQDQALGRTVVLKAIQRSHLKHSQLRERFRREAMITAQLQHPGVPPVYTLGMLSDGRPFFSMRLVEGRTLAQLLESRGGDRLKELPRFLRIFEHVCQTIAFAHSRGIIHRDLKPSNIVVGEYGTVHVMDWGIARVLEQAGGERSDMAAVPPALLPADETVALGLLRTDLLDAEYQTISTADDLLGTPQYMAPEQAAGDPRQDERADVFSLGAILFEILTGEPLRPVASVHIDELKEYTRANHQTRLSSLDDTRADAPILELARHCLELDPECRPRTASVVEAAVTAYLLHVLQRPEREMARFFELSLDLFCVAGLDGYFKQINQNFTRVLGLSTDELLTRPYIDFVHPDDRESTYNVVAQLSEGRPVVQFENRYRDAEGNYEWFQWTAKSIPEEGLVFAVAREITSRKHLELRLRAIVDSSPVAMIVSDSNGTITQLNRRTEQLFGYAADELVGQSIETLIPERYRAGHPDLRRQFLANPITRPGSGRELWGLRKDGTEIPIELGLSPLETDGGLFVTSVITDITEAKRQQGRFNALVESFPAALVMIDQTGRISVVNGQTEGLFGYARAELVGQPLQRLIPDVEPDGEPRPVEPCVHPNGLVRAEGSARTVWARHQNGARLMVELKRNPLDNGEAAFVLTPIASAVPAQETRSVERDHAEPS